MSIANIICQGKTGYLLTDGGTFWPDGRIASLGPKVLELPQYGAAITTRGDIILDELAIAIEDARLRNVDDLVAALPAILHSCLLGKAGGIDSAVGRLVNTHLYLVYFCRRRARAAGLFIASDREGLPADYEPFTPIAVREMTAPGADIAADLTDPSAFRIPHDAMKLMEGQRGQIWSYGEGVPGHHAAGEVYLTTVTQQEVSTRSIHRWPEDVGQCVQLDCCPHIHKNDFK